MNEEDYFVIKEIIKNSFKVYDSINTKLPQHQ